MELKTEINSSEGPQATNYKFPNTIKILDKSIENAKPPGM